MLVFVDFHVNILLLFVAYLHFFSYICCLSVAQFCCPQYRQQKSEMMLHTATSCNTQLQLATMSSNIRIEKTCEVCGNKYIAKKTITRSCSLTCARLLYKRTKRDEKIEAAIRKEAVIKPFNPSISQKEFLTIDEACQLINASRWTIYRLIDKGQLKAGKVGRNTRIPRTAINELFKLTEV